MKLQLIGTSLIVIRESGDKRIGRENTLFHHIAKNLTIDGFKFIVSTSGRDFKLGLRHDLCSDDKLIIRQCAKDYRKSPIIIHDPLYQIRDSSKDYNRYSEVILRVIR